MTDEKHGHPKFYEIVEDLKNLHSRKNHDYAAGGDPLGNFKRRSDLYSRYPGLDLKEPAVVALIDAMKQLDAAFWLLSNKHESKVEGIAERLKDVAVYSVLAMILLEEQKKDENQAETEEQIYLLKSVDKFHYQGVCKACSTGLSYAHFHSAAEGKELWFVQCSHCGLRTHLATKEEAERSWREDDALWHGDSKA